MVHHSFVYGRLSLRERTLTFAERKATINRFVNATRKTNVMPAALCTDTAFPNDNWFRKCSGIDHQSQRHGFVIGVAWQKGVRGWLAKGSEIGVL